MDTKSARNGWLMLSAAACLVLLAAGCGPTSNAGPVGQQAGVPSASVEPAAALTDAVDPTADHLHDLAGRLLLFQLKNGRLPQTLAQLDAQQPTGAPSGIDPADGKPLIYMPSGPRPEKVPGRLVVVQSTTHPAGRWCLILKDGAGDGQIITLVQRVPESVFRQLSGGAGW